MLRRTTIADGRRDIDRKMLLPDSASVATRQRLFSFDHPKHTAEDEEGQRREAFSKTGFSHFGTCHQIEAQ